jgi:hypothetical protein
MKIAVDKVLIGIDGKSVKDTEGKEPTLKHIAVEALLAVYRGEENLKGEEKLKRWLLATKIEMSNGLTEFTIEEVALIKELIGKAYGPLIVGPCWIALEEISGTVQ